MGSAEGLYDFTVAQQTRWGCVVSFSRAQKCCMGTARTAGWGFCKAVAMEGKQKFEDIDKTQDEVINHLD